MKLLYNDESHSYWLNGRRAKSASRVAKIPADGFTVEQWGLRQVAIGMTLDRTLVERVAATDIDNRDTIQAVCDAAKTAAKSHARADRGTQRHRVLELLLLGREHALITDQQRADAEVLRRTLDRYHLEPMPDRVEQFVAWPNHGVVGRYDAVMGHEGRPVLVDLKGGINAVKYPHSTAVQLALYRFAPHTSRTVERDGDRSTVTEWTTMPDGIDGEVAYVIYCDDDHDVGELWRIDIVHGRKGAELALAVVDWRKAHSHGDDLAHPVGEVESCLSVSPTPSPDVDEQEPPFDVPSAPSIVHDVEQASTGSVSHGGPVEEPFNLRRTQQAAQAHRESLVRPPAEPEFDVDDGIGIDEGGPCDAAAVDALGKRHAALDGDAKAHIDWLVADARIADVGFSLRSGRTVRRFELGRALVLLHEYGWPGDNHVRTAVVMASGDESLSQPTVPLGAAIGALDAEQATAFAELAQLIAEGRLRPDDDSDLLLPVA